MGTKNAEFRVPQAKMLHLWVGNKLWDVWKETLYEQSSIYSKTQKCNTFVHQATICQSITKKYYTTCSLKKKKYRDYEEFLPKYTSDKKLIIFKVLW